MFLVESFCWTICRNQTSSKRCRRVQTPPYSASNIQKCKKKRALAQATLPTTNSKSPSKMGNACEMILSFLLGKFQPSSLAVSFRQGIHPWLEIQLAPSGINAAIGGCSCTLGFHAAAEEYHSLS